MNKKVIIGIIFTCIMLMFSTSAYCELDPSTTRVKIDGSAAWTNITIGESYIECEMLNSPDSTLGTDKLEAHLTTDFDWSAMAIFSVSQYGGATSNATSPTTGAKNKSGISLYTTGYVQTSSILKDFTTTTGNFAGLYKDGGLKKYVKIIDKTTGKEYNPAGAETGRIATAYLTDGGTYGWYNSTRGSGTSKSYPIGVKSGLFGFFFGFNGSGSAFTDAATGGRISNTTFWPVIWN